MDGVEGTQLRVLNRLFREVEGFGRVGLCPVGGVFGDLGVHLKVRFSMFALTSFLLAAASAFNCAHFARGAIGRP
jgi:hypothetical protein